ncbi:MAG: RNA polymerase sigma factor [Oscillospiraceae bacterium]|nr:RNA polymerase sigma factor [Oscillospiraceae bacterium]
MKIDANLVTAAQSGDQESFAQLYQCVGDGLYKYALYSLGNAHDAEDAVSETFVEAWRGLKNLREPAAFQGWIFKILSIRIKRRVAGYIRQRSTFDIDDFIASPQLATGDPGPASLEKVELLRALETLKPEERMIVVLNVLHGYTTKQIAEMLRCPHGTVSSKLHRALQKLRNLLEKEAAV